MSLDASMTNLQQLFREKEYTKLISQGMEILDEHENEVGAEFYFLLAKTFLIQEQYDDAEYYLLKTKAVDTTNTEALFILANIKIILEDFDLAQSYIEDILKLEPHNLKAQVYAADISYKLQLIDTALETYQKIIATPEKGQLTLEEQEDVVLRAAKIYHEEGQLEDGLAFLDKTIDNNFSERLEVTRYQFCVALGESKRSELIASAERLHKNVPNNPSYAINLAQLYNDLEIQNKLYAHCLGLELTSDQKQAVLRNRAYNYINLKNWTKAIEDYNALIELDENLFNYKQRAKAKEEAGDLKGALNDLTHALKMQEDPDLSILEQRGLLLSKAKLYDKAIADLKTYIKLNADGDNADMYYNLGVVYSKKGEKSDAIKMLLQADQYKHIKATQFLMDKYPSQLAKVRVQSAKNLQVTYAKEVDRNQKSPILTKAFNKLWVIDMEKFVLGSQQELLEYPASITKMILEKLSKEMFLITPQGLLLFEGDSSTPLEAFYSVEVESEHAILLNIQATKGGASSSMRISLYEDSLLLNYPVAEEDVPAKYYLAIETPTEEQLTRLKNKEIDIPYIETIETMIGQLSQA